MKKIICKSNQCLVGAILLLAGGRLCNAPAQNSAPPPTDNKDWRQYGSRADQSKYMDLKQITKDNVKQLEIAWTYDPAGGGRYFFNPIVVDGMMYVVAKGSSVVALDSATGKELWSRNIPGIVQTGINYWESKDKKDKRLIYSASNALQAMDAVTGESITNFGNNGSTSLSEGLGRGEGARGQNTAPGAIYDDLIFVGSSLGEGYFSGPGHVRAFSCVTGKLVWVFHTIPWPGEYGYETWPKDAYKYAGGVNTWGEITVDSKNGIVYFPLGAPTFDYYGADRVGDDLYDESILALDARTGQRIWHFQTVHHGLWDYDLTSAPMLIDIQHDGEKIPAIAVAGKVGFLYVFNRLTGKPVWPIVEREVAPSDVPQEWASRTQPFPTAPPPFTRQIVTTNDINPYYSVSNKEFWAKRIGAAKTGLFHPLSDQYDTIAMPGAVGGANRGNTAADPEHGIVYVTANELPSVYKLVKGPPNAVQSSSSRGASPSLAAAAAAAPAQPLEPGLSATAIRDQTCNVCHVTLRATMQNIPALTNVAHLGYAEFQTIMSQGKGQMPSFPFFEATTVTDLYTLLGGVISETNGPAALAAQPGRRGGRGGRGGGYPEGVVAPTNTYRVGLGGYGIDVRDWFSPPWSTITAYDLNKGTIKWHVPLGNNAKFNPDGTTMTGQTDSQQRRGMIVTSTGIVFATCADGKIYAYDADDGKVIWSTRLPKNSEGLPAMYETNGRAYIVICLSGGSGYVAYGLPEKK